MFILDFFKKLFRPKAKPVVPATNPTVSVADHPIKKKKVDLPHLYDCAQVEKKRKP